MTLAHAPVILDIAGTALNDDDRRRLQHPLTGGLIFFTRNFESRRQITQLCADIKAVRPDALICVDHEGGRVQRFRRDGFTHLPAMRVIGELWMQDAMRAVDAVFDVLTGCRVEPQRDLESGRQLRITACGARAALLEQQADAGEVLPE